MRHSINNLFLNHPASVGETYSQHLITASRFALSMVLGGFACFIHALFPFLCAKTGSAIIANLHTTMITDRADNSSDDNE